jgi:hypothetical protein
MVVKSKKRTRTPSEYICHTLYLYFSGLLFRKTSEYHLLAFVKRNHVSVWKWINFIDQRKYCKGKEGEEKYRNYYCR